MEAQRYDWLRRSARTFFQGFIGVLILLAVPALNQIVTSVGSGGTAVIDVPFWRNVGIAAVAGGGTALVASLQNFAEDKAGMPALLKGRATSGQNPVPDGLP